MFIKEYRKFSPLVRQHLKNFLTLFAFFCGSAMIGVWIFTQSVVGFFFLYFAGGLLVVLPGVRLVNIILLHKESSQIDFPKHL